ncbi:MAG: polyhydroxyalkanoate synthesis regulator DNA-binding domain-containing protein [Caldilineaceae bacterium]|jgi:polyhydroxyalkanoate synthesis repressor PhaR|nr:polyhydroxyalkanoate synthesis regulator DNA-binding domain-containing protein [Caldilineaceae bacterium]
MPVIKRYPNRKLYDTEAKRYVTLDHIAALIQVNEDVVVIDHETGEDLTNLTLSQIIFEQQKKGSGLLSRSLLTNLIRTSGDTLEQMRRALIAPLHIEGAAKGEADVSAGDHSPLSRIDEVFQDVLTTLNVPTTRDLKRLQTQLDDLNARIGALLEAQQTDEWADESPAAPHASES